MPEESLFSRPETINRTHRPGDARLGDLLADNYDQSTFVLIGFPIDDGIARNFGRPGARKAPDAIRNHLYNLCPDPTDDGNHWQLCQRMVDLGNLRRGRDLEESQDLLGSVVSEILRDDKFPLILGGGHETAFGHFLGYVKARKFVSIVNLDAHADVRELIDARPHSGSPFKQALEHEGNFLRKYSVLGLQRHAVATGHLRYMENAGSFFSFRDDFSPSAYRNTLSAQTGSVMVTFDMDAVDSSSAPGVSAPCIHGISSTDFLSALFEAGQSTNVHSVDLVEVNPEFDIDSRTARLAAAGIWEFIRGFTKRQP